MRNKSRLNTIILIISLIVIFVFLLKYNSKNQIQNDLSFGTYKNDNLGISFAYPDYLKEDFSIIEDTFYRFNFFSSEENNKQLTIGSRAFPYLGGSESDECAEEICSKENFEFRKNRSVTYESSNNIIFYIYKGFGEALINSEGTTEADFETGNPKFPYVWVLASGINDADFIKILESIKLVPREESEQ
jgi:hypothetical protein